MDLELTTRLLALPALRQQAELLADEHHTALLAAMARIDKLVSFKLGIHPGLVEAQAALLADMTRWQSQAWALREIGRLLGWDCGDRVPTLEPDAHEPTIWEMDSCGTSNQSAVFITQSGYWSGYQVVEIDDLPTDRPAAIAAILLHLSGVSSV